MLRKKRNDRTDCACWNPRYGCVGYVDMDCFECPGYKSREQAKREQEETYRKLRALPPERQAHIADKYYNGMAPWDGAQTFRKLLSDKDVFEYMRKDEDE